MATNWNTDDEIISIDVRYGTKSTPNYNDLCSRDCIPGISIGHYSRNFTRVLGKYEGRCS